MLCHRRKRWAKITAKTSRWPNARLMLAHRLRYWPNINTTLGQRLGFAGTPPYASIVFAGKSERKLYHAFICQIRDEKIDKYKSLKRLI